MYTYTFFLSKQLQLTTAEHEVENYNQQIEKLRLNLPRIENEIATISENLQEKKKHFQEKTTLGVSPGVNQADDIQLQIDITKQNIELVDMRSEYALVKTKLRTTQRDLEQRMMSVRLNKNLLVSYGDLFSDSLQLRMVTIIHTCTSHTKSCALTFSTVVSDSCRQQLCNSIIFFAFSC